MYIKIDDETAEKEVKIKVSIEELKNKKQAIKRHIEAEQAEIALINLEIEELRKIGITI